MGLVGRVGPPSPRGTGRAEKEGAHSAPARERSGVMGSPRATEPGSGAEARLMWLCLPTFQATRSLVVGVTGDAVTMSAADADSESAQVRLSYLFQSHHAGLYRLARRMSRDIDDARDVVQETFLRAARSPGGVPHGEDAETKWLVRVLINVCRDRGRQQASRARLDARRDRASAGTAVDAERSYVAKATVWHALQVLSPRRRAVLVMYELEGRSIGDIARLLGISAVTVRWHLSRGRRELARAIRGGNE